MISLEEKFCKFLEQLEEGKINYVIKEKDGIVKYFSEEDREKAKLIFKEIFNL